HEINAGGEQGRAGQNLLRAHGAEVGGERGIEGHVAVARSINHLHRDDENGNGGGGVGFARITADHGETHRGAVDVVAAIPLGEVGGGRFHRVIRVRGDGSEHGPGRLRILGEGKAGQTHQGESSKQSSGTSCHSGESPFELRSVLLPRGSPAERKQGQTRMSRAVGDASCLIRDFNRRTPAKTGARRLLNYEAYYHT